VSKCQNWKQGNIQFGKVFEIDVKDFQCYQSGGHRSDPYVGQLMPKNPEI